MAIATSAAGALSFRFAWQDGFEDSRPRDRQISVEYDPDTDDYEMQVSPELPEVIDLKETQLIVKQIAQLETRIDQGGDLPFWNCHSQRSCRVEAK